MDIQILVIHDTYLKTRPVQATELSDDEKQYIQAESILEITSYVEEGKYYRIFLKVPILGFDIWFVDREDVEIIVANTSSKKGLQIVSPEDLRSSEIVNMPIRRMATPENTKTKVLLTSSEAQLKNSTPGKVLFDTPHQMKVGVSERVSVRITKTITQDFFEGLTHSQEAEVENIRISRFMTVSLRGDDFKIDALSYEEQIIEDEEYTQWDWRVVPLKRGSRKLYVSITIQVRAENEQARKSLPILEKEISVKINPLQSTSTFIRQYWQWLIASAIIPIASLILSKK